MTYFQDLSDCTYGRDYHRRQGTLNVGWLDAEQEFEQAVPSGTRSGAIAKYQSLTPEVCTNVSSAKAKSTGRNERKKGCFKFRPRRFRRNLPNH